MSKLALVFSRVALYRNTRIFGEMDPYCKIRSSIDSDQTPPHIDGGNNPDWSGRTYEIRYQNPSETITFEVWDKDETKDVQVGEARELISKLLGGRCKLNLVYNGRMAGQLEVNATHPQKSELNKNFLSEVEENRSYYEESKRSAVLEEEQQYFRKPKDQSEFRPNESELKSEYFYEDNIPKQELPNDFDLSPEEMQKQQEYLKLYELNKQMNPKTNSPPKKKEHIMSFTSKEPLKCSGEREVEVMTTGIQNRPISPIVLILISGVSADLGRRNEDGNSWLEIVLLNGFREPISENYTVYRNTKDFKEWEFKMSDKSFLKLMNEDPTAQVALYARTFENGYSCDVDSCKIEVVFSSFDSDYEKYQLF